ncbi:hypothetical protein JCM10914A_20790 [Paenibacillus sp. JCM 10914]|uniref:DUF1934 domain-containing protein n=1 Tax=Paenibacillus sp. JCM 10914 TaxID=1236974 RepID=UPI0003CC7B65|nr:DUF1934 domain-containing protein [Paenibacillus sp. JCM 10914]GAE09298.1 hypothetical protein JCM10914_5654 [Paenibacillus sp. JCM 10914]
MNDRQQVSIRLHSLHAGENTVQELPAEAFAKGNALYIRYTEPALGPHQGETRAMLKLTEDELKLIRHGEVESEQAFQLGQRLPGYYRSPFTSFKLSTHTQRLELELEGMFGRVAWAYDLYVFDELSGHFSISLTIQEAHES